MSVAAQLGLEAPEGDLWMSAQERWALWQQAHPVLDVGEDLHDLREWVRRADPAEANLVLLTLAELGAQDGGDDPAATGALLWLLLPGAAGIARALSRLSERIDELVAAQLWICARTVSWRKHVRVAATVLMNTRREVLTDLGVSASAPVREMPFDDVQAALRTRHDPREPSFGTGGCDLLYDLLEEAADDALVSLDDCRILLELAEVADSPRTGRGHAGLLGRTATSGVAASRGVSRATLARRARAALCVLQDTYATRARPA